MSVHRRVAVWLLAAAAFAVSAPSTWATGEVTFGTQKWDQSAPEAKYQEFVDYPQGSFLYSLMLIQGQGRNQIQIMSTNAFQKDQQTSFLWTSGTRFRFDLVYGQIPHNFSQVARTSYTEIEPGKLVLDDAIRQTNQSNPGGYTNTMRDYLEASPNIPLTHRTDRYGARARVRPATGWILDGSVVQQKKSGNKAYGGAFGFNSAIEIWEPIQHRTTDAQIYADYKKNDFTFRVAGGISIFENMINDLVWDNPKRFTDTTATPGYIQGDASARGQLDLYPDNQAYYGNLALGYRLPSRTAITGALGVKFFRQDDDWLPYTINSALTEPNDPTNALPGTRTDGKAAAITGDLRLATRVLDPVGANVRFRYHDYDNETPEFDFPGYVRMDQVWEAIPLTSHPYGHKTAKLSGDLNVRPVSRLRLEGGGEWILRERTHREVPKDQEVAAFARADLRITNSLSVDGRYRYGNRTQDEFHISEYQNPDSSFHEQPGLRRYDVANRRQQLGEAKVSYLFNQNTTAAARYQYGRNKYPDSDLGLQDDEMHLIGLDLTWLPEERVDFLGGGGWSQRDALQESRTSGGSISTNPADNWTALLRDRNWYAYVGMEWDMVPDVWTFELDYEFSWARGEYLLSNPGDTAEDMPATQYIRHLAMFNLEYAVWRDTELGVRYFYDNYKVTDFANQGIPLINPAIGGSANSIFLADNSLPYTAHRAALYLTRTF